MKFKYFSRKLNHSISHILIFLNYRSPPENFLRKKGVVHRHTFQINKIFSFFKILKII
jgi:hypothetical protein